MVSYCVDLTSVYSIIVGKFILTSVSASVIISVLLFKRLSPLYVAISYFSFKQKATLTVWIVGMTYSDNLPCHFWCSTAAFDFPKIF